MTTPNPTPRRAAITGASGLVGGNLAALLLEQGVHVTATRRASSPMDHLADLQIRWMDAELLNVDALAHAFEGAHVVFHCAAIATQTRRTVGAHRATNVDGTRAVLQAARLARVPRLVHVSSVVTCAVAAPGAPDVTEDDPWNLPAHGLDEEYARTKRAAEDAVLAAHREGLVDAVVVNPATMFGPRDSKPSTGRLILELHSGKIPGATSGVSNFVDVRDVCRGMIAAWTAGRGGERYILGGVNMGYREAFQMICEELGERAPRFTLPDPVVRLGGWLGDLGERVLDQELQLNSAIAAYAVERGYRFSSAKAVRELGYTASPVRQAIRDAVAWFRTRGML